MENGDAEGDEAPEEDEAENGVAEEADEDAANDEVAEE